MSEPGPVQLAIDLSELESAPVGWSNYFLLQYDHGEWILTVAQLPPPAITGEDQLERMRALASVTAKPIARVAVSRAKLASLAALIDRQLERFPEGVIGESETEGD